jgi:hydroxyacylglutathione hydrolase
VDPGDAEPVIQFCQSKHLTPVAILVTHRHWDHTNGLPDMRQSYPEIPIYGSISTENKNIQHKLKGGDRVVIDQLAVSFDVFELPGHTLDHIAYYSQLGLFCGDTLFSAGCGRLFDGSAHQLHQSLSQLSKLPADTSVYCTHEYTLSNINFALVVEPNNQALQDYHIWAKQRRDNNLPTLPTTISKELMINPFLRCQQPNIQHSVSSFCQTHLNSEQDVFTALRKWKDSF